MAVCTKNQKTPKNILLSTLSPCKLINVFISSICNNMETIASSFLDAASHSGVFPSTLVAVTSRFKASSMKESSKQRKSKLLRTEKNGLH